MDKMKENDMIISVNAEKSCDEVQQPFMVETFNKLRKEGRNYLDNKSHIWKTNIILSGKTENFL